ncbi:MAG: hypothetical protein MUF18_20190 [Fimbriiglobus sp.]|nr:hypothetical protein [Fimbriiglobus sp.]
MTPFQPGWTPYADGSWPPDGSIIDVLLKSGEVLEGCRYRHWDLLERPVGFPLRVTVVAWREAGRSTGKVVGGAG